MKRKIVHNFGCDNSRRDRHGYVCDYCRLTSAVEHARANSAKMASLKRELAKYEEEKKK